MAAGLHDLVKRVLLSEAEEHFDTTTLTPATNVAEGALGTIGEMHPDVVELLDEAARYDVAKNSGVAD